MTKVPQTFDQLYPGQFLKAGLLEGKKVPLTIAGVTLEDLEGEEGPERKAIVSFKESPMRLVLAKLNGLCLKAMFGPQVQEWVGKRIVIYPTADIAPMRRGEECIRIWGSPDIQADRAVEIRLPRRKAFTITLHKTGGQA